MKIFLSVLVMFIFVNRGYTQPSGDIQLDSIPKDTLRVNEVDIWLPIQEGNYKVMYCNYFQESINDTSKNKKFIKGISMKFLIPGMFSGATIFSTSFQDADNMAFSSIKLYINDKSFITLDKAWFLDAHYYEIINDLNVLLRITAKTNYEYE
ncbi:MAG: hypothetical protein NT085_03040 [candidate division SR1 bacterium]|nr:hypothetical protein [candidate division SR1 bacterium]